MTILESISVTISICALVASVAALFVARSSLNLARHVADRDRRDWTQRKWFDLYLKTNEAYDELEAFQSRYDKTSDTPTEFKRDWNNLMFRFRTVHAMASVFPKSPVVDQLFSATAVFKDLEEGLSKDRLRVVFDALDTVRQMAYTDSDVLTKANTLTEGSA
jgi:hypothetical protein